MGTPKSIISEQIKTQEILLILSFKMKKIIIIITTITNFSLIRLVRSTDSILFFNSVKGHQVSYKIINLDQITMWLWGILATIVGGNVSI